MSSSPEASFVHPSACVDDLASLGPGCRVWHFSHVMAGAKIGARSSLGQGVFVASDVIIGPGAKIQNNVSLYSGVELEAEVFCGPSCVFTNVAHPRAAITRRPFARTVVRFGATIGANATIVCGTALGRHCFVAAGAVVTAGNYPDYALLLGAPAVRRGWVGRHGRPLVASGPESFVCPQTEWRYREEAGELRCLDWAEERPLEPP